MKNKKYLPYFIGTTTLAGTLCIGALNYTLNKKDTTNSADISSTKINLFSHTQQYVNLYSLEKRIPIEKIVTKNKELDDFIKEMPQPVRDHPDILFYSTITMSVAKTFVGFTNKIIPELRFKFKDYPQWYDNVPLYTPRNSSMSDKIKFDNMIINPQVLPKLGENFILAYQSAKTSKEPATIPKEENKERVFSYMKQLLTTKLGIANPTPKEIDTALNNIAFDFKMTQRQMRECLEFYAAFDEKKPRFPQEGL